MTKRKPYFLQIDGKRMFKVKEDGAIGFAKLLVLNDIDHASAMIQIANCAKKEAIAQVLDECNHVDNEDMDIVETLANCTNDYYLSNIMNCCVRFLQETKPVSSDNLVVTTRTFLEKLNIECNQRILSDIMYAIGIYTHDDAMLQIDNMTQDFQLTTEAGNYVWKCLLKRERAKAYVMFQVSAHDDTVLIDMKPDDGGAPQYIRGTTSAIKEVAKFIEECRKEATKGEINGGNQSADGNGSNELLSASSKG